MPATPTPSEVTLNKALATHLQWRRKLQEAVLTGEALDIEAIRRDDCCELGTWLYAEGLRLYGTYPAFTKLLEVHREFHAITGIIAEIINSKNYEQAKAMLMGNSQFSAASTDVSMAIIQLRTATDTGQ